MVPSLTLYNNLYLEEILYHYCKKITFKYKKNIFTSRIVNIWNSLPNSVILAPNVNVFKNKLYQFWKN